MSNPWRASRRRFLSLVLCFGLLGLVSGFASHSSAEDSPRVFRAGAATSNITPPLGELIVGGWSPFPAENIHDELHARCLVLDDGSTKLAIALCDNVGIPTAVFNRRWHVKDIGLLSNPFGGVDQVRMNPPPDHVHVPLQVLKIGDLGIAAVPFETCTETGLQWKDRSPLKASFTIELANGSFGYLPTPSQHRLGGYETWLGQTLSNTKPPPRSSRPCSIWLANNSLPGGIEIDFASTR